MLELAVGDVDPATAAFAFRPRFAPVAAHRGRPRPAGVGVPGALPAGFWGGGLVGLIEKVDWPVYGV